MIELIKKDKLNLLDKEKPIILAVSTGIDSMSLLDYLYKKGYKLIIAHINHKKRIESDTEYEFLKDYSNKLNVPFEGYVLNENINSNFQMEARKIRYNFFYSLCDKYNTNQIVTAHQYDDLVETIMFRLLRGTSLKGYSGIKEETLVNSYKIIRPLLNTTRDDIIKYQKENDIPYFNDSSNDTDHYTRNKIRHHIIPEFSNINESFYKSFSNFSNDIYDVYSLIRRLSNEFINDKSKIINDSIAFSYDDFINLDRAIRREVIIESINILSSNTVEVPHERIDSIIDTDNKNKSIDIKDGYIFFLDFKTITIKKPTDKIDFSLEINDFGLYNTPNNLNILISQKTHKLPTKISYMLCYNMEYEIFPITVRTVAKGDKITVNGITKKVYDLLKEHKVPKDIRDNTLVFLNKDGIFFIPNIIRKETDTNKQNKLYITVSEDLINDEEK